MCGPCRPVKGAFGGAARWASPTLDSSTRPWTWLAIGRPLPSGIRPQVSSSWVGNRGEQVCPTPEYRVGNFKEPHQAGSPTSMMDHLDPREADFVWTTTPEMVIWLRTGRRPVIRRTASRYASRLCPVESEFGELRELGGVQPCLGTE